MNVDSSSINLGSFCSGVGWLDIAARLAFEHHGHRTRSVFVAEWDAYAAEVLRSRMEDQSLEPAPIWCGDLREFPARHFHGLVGAVVFGFPCQDISCAGRGEGIHGKRSGLFFDILQAVRTMGCRILLMENVSAITVRGLDTVLGSLAEAGFHAEWLCLQAAQVGASHRRERWFCVAYRENRQRKWQSAAITRGAESWLDRSGHNVALPTQRGFGIVRQPPGGDGQPDGSDDVVDNTPGSGGGTQRSGRQSSHTEQGRQAVADTPDTEGRWDEQERGSDCGTAAGRTGEDVGDPAQQQQQQSGLSLGAITQQSRPDSPDGYADGIVFAPGPSDRRWPDILHNRPHVAPAIEPRFCLLADGKPILVDASRADQLRCAGNACVVLQAAVAFAKLLERCEIGASQ